MVEDMRTFVALYVNNQIAAEKESLALWKGILESNSQTATPTTNKQEGPSL